MVIILLFIGLFVFIPSEAKSAEFTVPQEAIRIENLSQAAFRKIKTFKYSQKFCIDNDCVVTYGEINRPNAKGYFTTTVNSIYRQEYYIVGGGTYMRGYGVAKDSETWIITNVIPELFRLILSKGEEKISLQNCLKFCPALKPDEIQIKEDIIDGKECRVLDIIYPDYESQPFRNEAATGSKTINRLFFLKDNYLPYGHFLDTRIYPAQDSPKETVSVNRIIVEARFFDYDIPVDIALPPEAVDAEFVAPDKLKFLK